MREIEHGNQFSTQIKGNNSVLIWQNLQMYNFNPLLPNINYYEKFEENLSRNAQDRERKRSGDGQTNTQLKFLNGGYNIIPNTFLVAGYKKSADDEKGWTIFREAKSKESMK